MHDVWIRLARYCEAPLTGGEALVQVTAWWQGRGNGELSCFASCTSWAIIAKATTVQEHRYIYAMLQIDITSFKSGVHHVELTPDPADLELDSDTYSDIHVLARLDCHRDRILVSLDVHGIAVLTCDRTLQEYDQPLEGTYQVLFGPERMVGAESDNFDEVRVLHPSDRAIDVTDLVRDTLLLAVPQRKIAPGADQEEIQMEFGATASEDRAQSDIDPRWDALRELRDRSDSSSN